ncbi:hypothetical protein DU43_15535 [Methanosarcina mazei]|uniref:Uncharacterized protein n=1 Tax=Methanosarcina mazei TaxID=2209 RepID=A0A0F8KEW6_METMZ|nr:hypothetical protein DU43_15535 [Methanosarcina mazei]
MLAVRVHSYYNICSQVSCGCEAGPEGFDFSFAGIVNNYMGSGFPGDFDCPVSAAVIDNNYIVGIKPGEKDKASD